MLNKNMELSRKKLRLLAMPPKGTVIGDYTVSYVNYMKFRFTGIGSPTVGDAIEWDGKKYEVTMILVDGKFSAEFRGMVQTELPPIEDASTLEDIYNVEHIEEGQEPAGSGPDTPVDQPQDLCTDEGCT